MKFTHTFTVCLMSALLFSFTAKAESVLALTVTADYYAGQVYGLYLDLDEDHKITNIELRGTDITTRTYSIDDLSNGFLPLFTVTKKVLGMHKTIPVVSFKIDSMDNGDDPTADISLEYVEKASEAVFGGEPQIHFHVEYDATTSAYRIIDKRSGKVITSANVLSPVDDNGQATGISDIVTK